MRKVCLIAVAMAANGWAGSRGAAQEAPKPALAAVSKTPTIDESLEWKSAFNPKISPDGKRVVYELQSANWEDNSFDRNLWIADIASGEVRHLTSAKKRAVMEENEKWFAQYIWGEKPAPPAAPAATEKKEKE